MQENTAYSLNILLMVSREADCVLVPACLISVEKGSNRYVIETLLFAGVFPR